MFEIALFKQLFKARDRARLHPARAALACVIGHQVGGGVLDNLAAPVSGALEGRVVDHHKFAIFGQVKVQFTATNAMLEALLKAGKGVFRCFAFGAAMAINQGHSYSLSLAADSSCSRASRRACACFCKM